MRILNENASKMGFAAEPKIRRGVGPRVVQSTNLQMDTYRKTWSVKRWKSLLFEGNIKE